MAKRPVTNDFWQSYGDLAMGLMAVFVFILILLLHRESQKTRELEEVKLDLEQSIQKLDAERAEFALELLQLLDSTWSIVERQDAAETWLSAVFAEGGCQLTLSDEGALKIGAQSGQGADLYVSGDTSLSEAGRQALASCRENFRLLANCLNPKAELSVAEQRACRRVREDIAATEELEGVKQFRTGIEALVLEGTTDRATLAPMAGVKRSGPEEARNYTENARLGAERARQAMTFLLNLVRDNYEDDYDALPVLMNKIRVETSSFGRFQAGPPEWRDGSCSADKDYCDEARRLSLRVRWKKSELRKPYEEVRMSMCRRIATPEDPLTIGLISAGRNVEDILKKYGCKPEAPQAPAPVEKPE